MAATDHLHPALFHGSGHDFGEGSEIVPTPDWVHGGSDKVYTSSNLEQAAWYAADRSHSGRAAQGPTQGRLFGSVYEVASPSAKPAGNKIPGHHTSEEPATVSRHVAFVSAGENAKWLSGPAEGQEIRNTAPFPKSQRLAASHARRQQRLRSA